MYNYLILINTICKYVWEILGGLQSRVPTPK